MPAIGNRPTGNAHHNRETCTCPPCVNSRRGTAENLPPNPPNKKQEKLAEIVVDSLAKGEPISAKAALAESGYRGRALDHPSEVFNTESFQAQAIKEAQKKGLNLKFLMGALKLLCKAERGVYLKDASGNIVKFSEPDNQARAKGIEMGLKMYDVFPKEQKQGGALVIIRASIMTPGHERHCTCPSCTEALEKLAQKCREQVAKVPELEPPEE